jgi:hypothetical protein
VHCKNLLNESLFMKTKTPEIFFHLHLVSDATGETLNAIAKAACAQFDMVEPIEHVYSLVRSKKQLDRVLNEIEAAPGVILYTMMNNDLRGQLEQKCLTLNMPYMSVLDSALSVLQNYLGTELTHKPGGQHELDAGYFARIEAMRYTMAHDDGQNTSDLNLADIVLVGVSRTSKTPTCIYLANRGIKAANIPVVPDCPLPGELDEIERPLVVGLIVSPDRLVQIRRNRLLSLNETGETDYVDLVRVREETADARRLFAQKGWPVIDVSRRSIEETAAGILNLYHHQGEDQ